MGTRVRKAGIPSVCVVVVAALASASPAVPEGLADVGTLNLYGLPGLLDLPTATSLPDAEMAVTWAGFSGTKRGTLSFQVTPRLTASFRYSKIDGIATGGTALFDRSFDLHYRFLDETDWRPSFAVGLRDIAGTGIYSGEYIVATKHFAQTFSVTGGIGWGRLASRGGFDNPLSAFGDHFDTRPPYDVSSTGGQFSFDQWFRGEAAFFGGVAWRPTDRLTLMAEYSSDAYIVESAAGEIDASSAWNFGARYEVRPGAAVGLHYMQGDRIGLSGSFTLNPRRSPVGGSRAPAPLPIVPRAGNAGDWGPDWVNAPGSRAQVEAALSAAFKADGIDLERMELTGSSVRVAIRNSRWSTMPQAIGRAARIMAAVLPPSVETFTVEPLAGGQGAAAVTLRRSDLEKLETAPDGAAQLLARTRLGPAGETGAPLVADAYPRLTWGIGPYVAASYFDPDKPILGDLGLQLTGGVDLAPGLSISGAARLKLAGNLDESDRISDSVLQHVRSDANIYAREGASGIDYLTIDWIHRPSRDVYTRLSFGYLESMFGGISGEILWRPADRRLALGAELNYVMQRDFDRLFGFQDYDVVTGHVSAYYDLGNGFTTQLDVGQYLAGDVGATISIDRTFANGWKVGAFATKTDVSAEDFGEGSFDKGIRLTIPLAWLTGQATRESTAITLRPVQRDGGARLDVRNRLYPMLQDHDTDLMADQWGTFWR